jgi:hypothetical protein
MDLRIVFIGRAEPLAELYEGVGTPSFALVDMASTAAGLVVPNIGDRVRLRMHPGPDMREFRCTGRLFDFSEEAAPALTIELDMP